MISIPFPPTLWITNLFTLWTLLVIEHRSKSHKNFCAGESFWGSVLKSLRSLLRDLVALGGWHCETLGVKRLKKSFIPVGKRCHCRFQCWGTGFIWPGLLTAIVGDTHNLSKSDCKMSSFASGLHPHHDQKCRDSPAKKSQLLTRSPPNHARKTEIVFQRPCQPHQFSSDGTCHRSSQGDPPLPLPHAVTEFIWNRIDTFNIFQWSSWQSMWVPGISSHTKYINWILGMLFFFVCVYIHQHRRYAHKSYRLRDDRRKFRSQTSDNMERWKSRGQKSQRREEKKEDQIRERVRGKEIEKVVRSQNTLFFQLFVAPKGRKVGSLKRRVRSHLGRWEMKNCTPSKV